MTVIEMLYFDANATSRLTASAREAIDSFCASQSEAGNPSSIHSSGQRARACLSGARQRIKTTLFPDTTSGANSRVKLFFTSGGTESCATMIDGFLCTVSRKGTIVSSSIEHPAVHEHLLRMRGQGWNVNLIAPQTNGVVRAEDFVSAITMDTDLAILMAANNETGAIQPVARTATMLRDAKYSGPIVCDFTQALGKCLLRPEDLFAAGVSALAISGHKIGALSGIGAVCLNTTSDVCFEFAPLLLGGPQEDRMRAGTENLLGIVSLDAAIAERFADLEGYVDRMNGLKEYFYSLLISKHPSLSRISPVNSGSGAEGEACLSNTLMLNFPGERGDDLVVAFDLDGLAVSTGSACASGKQEPSRVVMEMGYDRKAAREVIRFSLDWDATEAAVEAAAEIVTRVLSRGSQTIQSVVNF